ncbi:MAG: glycosyltransferase family 4 protein [Bacteroidales bacterium]|nr:glycosyltransferase family 4 protein [Bacteroidales bacterium]
MPTNKKILIITYYWPPCGGAGVQRWLKFAKYLPEYGWEPIVITVDPDFAHYPAIDESLEKDINDSLKVYKTKALNYFRPGLAGKSGRSKDTAYSGNKGMNNRLARFIRGNFFIPDPRRGWNSHAVKMASEIIRKEGIEYVISTSPPHSTQLIGLKLKTIFPEIKWICDLRDPWTDIYYYDKFHGTWPARIYDRRLENKVLRKADSIISVGDKLADLFSVKLQDRAKKITVITNGYDEQDFSSLKKNPPSTLTITYVGSLSDQYPVKSLIESLRKLSDRGTEFKFRFIGVCPPGIKRKITSALPEDSFYYLSYRSHREALTAMITSSVLLVLIPDNKHNKIIITGKLFEYLRTELPILAIGPKDGEAAGIISECKAGSIFGKEDIEDITAFLSSGEINRINYTAPQRYDRRKLTARLAELLDKLQ